MFFRVTAPKSRADVPSMKQPLFSFLFACALGAVALAPVSARAADKEVAVLKTSQGEMVIEFWPDVAPNTVANFIKLAKSGFYDGTAFHRIIDGFMIQGGDPLTKDQSQEAHWGTGHADERIKAEFNDRPHDFGVISMARSSNPDSASSQFFICLGRAQQLDGNYTAFGKLIKGEDVLKKLGKTPVGPDPSGRENSRPTSRVALESVKIVSADSVK
jgi:peptidyl-prolyl cis-trans isomerase B (cyclophilin B)